MSTSSFSTTPRLAGQLDATVKCPSQQDIVRHLQDHNPPLNVTTSPGGTLTTDIALLVMEVPPLKSSFRLSEFGIPHDLELLENTKIKHLIVFSSNSKSG